MCQKIYLLIIIIFIYGTVFSMEYISSPLISGAYDDIAVKNNTAYAANDWGIIVFDVTDKTNPILVNALPSSEGIVDYVDIHDDYIIVSTCILSGMPGVNVEGKTFIYSISNPHNPVYITEIEEYTRKSFIKDNFLFLQTYNSVSRETERKLKIYDINDIMVPTQVVEIEDVKSFDLSNNELYTIYITNNDTIMDLKIYDLENISNPTLLNEMNLPVAYNYLEPYMTLDNNLLYIGGFNTLYILNIDNPVFPEILSYSECGGIMDWITKFAKNDSYLYFKGGRIVNVLDPENPEVAGNYAPTWPPYNVITNVYIYDNYLYVTNWGYGFYIMDLSNPVEPSQTSWYVNWNFYHGIYKSGNYAYVASADGLIVIDVSDPENGFEIGNCYTGWSNDVFVEDNYAYMASDGGLIILDVSDPESPYAVDDYGFSCDKLIKENNLVYALNDVSAVIKIFDVNDPHNIQFLGTCDLMFNAYDLCLKDNYLYIAGGYEQTYPTGYDPGGLKIVDVTDPYNPQWINSINPDSTRFFRSIEIKDNYVFMGSNEPGIYVFDVSNPLLPFVHSYIEVEQEAGICDMEIQGDYLYTTSLRGKYIFDIAEINFIELVDFYPGGESNNCWSISVDGNYIYEASSFAVSIYYSEYSGAGIEEPLIPNDISKTIKLYQNYPNPFNPNTNICFQLSETDKINLSIYNIKGALIKKLINDKIFSKGSHFIMWNGKNNQGKEVSSNVYLYRLRVGDNSISKKMLLVR
ncbi:MAG: T9SS type A sorting domain-containing protein [Candidatus Cloacimonetes bacterium]|nr:T9SS type A sorting domain-containing protein [Candidatus Cloacimonadota bacterium]